MSNGGDEPEVLDKNIPTEADAEESRRAFINRGYPNATIVQNADGTFNVVSGAAADPGDEPQRWWLGKDPVTGSFVAIETQPPFEKTTITGFWQTPEGQERAATLDPNQLFSTLDEAGGVLEARGMVATHVVEPAPNGYRIVVKPPDAEELGIKGTKLIDGTDDVMVLLTNGDFFVRPQAAEAPEPPKPWVPSTADIEVMRQAGYRMVEVGEGNYQLIPSKPEPFVPGEATPTTGGTLVPIGPDRFQYVPDAETPATFTPSEADLAAATGAGVRMIQTGVNQYQLVRPTFEAGVVESGGREFVLQPDGSLQPLDRQYEPGVVVKGGREFTQGPTGQLTPLAPETFPDLTNIINQMFDDGNVEGALALKDFQDRPTSTEYFNLAMQYAQSPGDVMAISNIARGQTILQPPARVGDIQQIAEPPEYLQDAWTRLQNQMRGGAGTPQDIAKIIEIYAAERKADKKRLADLEEKDQALEFQAKIDAALAPFKKQITGLESQLAAAKGAAAQPTTVNPLTVPPAGLTDVPREALTGQVGASLLSPEQTEVINAFAARQPPPTSAPAPTSTPLGGGTVAPTAAPAATTPPVSEPTFAPEAGKFINPFTGEDTGSFAALEKALGLEPVKKRARGGPTVGLTITGEEGPELSIHPAGSKVIPLKQLKGKNLAKLRKTMGVQDLQTGGTVEPLLPYDPTFGVRQAIAGRPIEPTRRRLLTAAGLPVLSQQARQNLLPEEYDVFARLTREARIPEGAMLQELRSAQPGVNQARRRAIFAPQVLR